MPAQFQSTYTPIAAAGTGAQIKHLSKLLATQLTTAGLGKGVEETKYVKTVSTAHVLSISNLLNFYALHVFECLNLRYLFINAGTCI